MSETNETDLARLHSVITAKFIDPGFNYWFTNHDHVRSPFPNSILSDAKERTTTIFLEWIEGLKEKELKDMQEDEFVEMFETILFNEAIKLVDDDDQRLTISYPFMPRMGDMVKHKDHGAGKVVERKEVITKENKKMLELTVSAENSGLIWKTEFELTA